MLNRLFIALILDETLFAEKNSDNLDLITDRYLAKSTQIGKPDISNRYPTKRETPLSVLRMGFLIPP